MTIEYAIIVKNKTRLETLIERFNTKSQAQFYIERQGGNFDDYEQEHTTFQQALVRLQTQLSSRLKNKIVERSFLPNFIFSNKHVILVIGQDGLVANTAKYARGIPIIAVNPDPQRYDGVLLPFTTDNFMHGVDAVLTGTYPHRVMRFAQAQLNDGQRLLAFNDLFIGAASHVSARYRISYNQQTEEQSSSGLIVSTKAGSTGWMSSVFNMANGITGLFGQAKRTQPPPFRDDDLLFAVREPFKSIRTQADLVAGFLTPQTRLVVESFMPANGVIFSDGIEADFLKFNSGTIATIGLADERAILVTNPTSKKERNVG